MTADVSDLTVDRSTSLEHAMKVIDRNGSGIVFITDSSERLVGTATDGDVRRGILDGIGLDESVETVMNDDPLVASAEWDRAAIGDRLDLSEVKARVNEPNTLSVPVIDDNGVPPSTWFT